MTSCWTIFWCPLDSRQSHWSNFPGKADQSPWGYQHTFSFGSKDSSWVRNWNSWHYFYLLSLLPFFVATFCKLTNNFFFFDAVHWNYASSLCYKTKWLVCWGYGTTCVKRCSLLCGHSSLLHHEIQALWDGQGCDRKLRCVIQRLKTLYGLRIYSSTLGRLSEESFVHFWLIRGFSSEQIGLSLSTT